MDIDDTTKVKIWQDMYKQAAWERDVAIKQLEQLGYELGDNYIRASTKLITEGEIMDKIEIAARNYSREDCDVNMLKRLAEDIYISGFKRGVEKEKLAKSKTVTNSHDFDQWWSDYITSHTTEKDTDENASNKVVNFKPGDKFILELGQERKMFDEFEIKGTDLYVRTDLLDKLTRYEPEEKTEVKSEIICNTNCEGFICHKNGIYGWCPKAERWGCEYFYELERRNDG